MQLCVVDVGNSRIKWRLQGQATEQAALDQLHWCRQLPSDCTVALSHVASMEHAHQLTQALAPRPVQRLLGVDQLAGFRCGYASSIGSDRLLAGFAAAQLYPNQPLWVISCGTALTVDRVEDNRLAGGAISAGLALVRRALASGTAALNVEGGHTVALPHNTADALSTGAMASVVGAARYFIDNWPPSLVLLSGGDAAAVAQHLGREHQLVPDLVLQGLEYWAAQWLALKNR